MTKKINVLELNNIDIYGKRFDGYSIAEYADKLSASTFDIKLLVNHKLGNDNFVFPLFNNQTLEALDWKIDELENSIGTKNQISPSLYALLEHPAYQKADILHFHMYHNMHLPIEFLTQIPPQKKIILDLHDTFWLTDNNIPMLEVFSPSNVNKASLNAQRRRVLQSIDAEFIVHSPYMLNLFKKSSATKNLSAHLINFGINLETFKPLKNHKALLRKYNIPEQNIVLLFRAQKAFKGIDYIIDALSQINSERKITLLTVGAETGLVQSLSPKYHVKEFGLVSDEQKMAEIYNLSDMFLAPSTEESFGFMAVEAMACGVPVIVFDGTALPDTVNAPSVGISTPKNSTSLRLAIEGLINNPGELKKRSKKSLEFATTTYNEKAYLNNNLALYKKISKKEQRITKSPVLDRSTAPTKQLNTLFDRIKKDLSGGNVNLQPVKLDYNNQNVQKAILDFNKKIYYNTKDSTPFYKRIPIYPKIRKIIRKIIKRQS